MFLRIEGGWRGVLIGRFDFCFRSEEGGCGGLLLADSRL
jgi:hypothetical protein